jgi:hypothetical protein
MATTQGHISFHTKIRVTLASICHVNTGFLPQVVKSSLRVACPSCAWPWEPFVYCQLQRTKTQAGCLSLSLNSLLLDCPDFWALCPSVLLFWCRRRGLRFSMAMVTSSTTADSEMSQSPLGIEAPVGFRFHLITLWFEFVTAQPKPCLLQLSSVPLSYSCCFYTLTSQLLWTKWH